jgi:hypothetical protein
MEEGRETNRGELSLKMLWESKPPLNFNLYIYIENKRKSLLSLPKMPNKRANVWCIEFYAGCLGVAKSRETFRQNAAIQTRPIHRDASMSVFGQITF